MSLLLLDSETAASEMLNKQLSDLGLKVLTTADTQDAMKLCALGGVRVLVCCDYDQINQMGDLPVGVGLVFASRSPLTLEITLACLQVGVQDCWQLPMSGFDMQARISVITQRVEKWLAESNGELHAMRIELERDQRAGQYIQLGMLPPNPMGIGHFRLQHRVEPSLILSGDFVDYFQITDRYFACYVADVAGHGASSAFVTVLLKNFSRRLRREYRVSMLSNPGEILSWINDELIDQQIDKHVAMFFGIIDTQENCMQYSNAAHFPPAMLVGEGGVTALEQKGKPLGIFPHAQFESEQVAFPPGARVAVFSDGVLDLILASTLEEKERKLVETVRDCEDIDALWAQLDLSKLGQDDVSCLLIRHER